MEAQSNVLYAAFLGITALSIVGLARSDDEVANSLPRPSEASLARMAPTKAGNALRDQHPIDLNGASRGELELLPGVGPVLAQRIIEERGRAGPFHSMSDLRKRVSGIGPMKVQKLKPFIALTPSPQRSPNSADLACPRTAQNLCEP